MLRRTVTWAGLAATDAERKLLRGAGFTPSELADREPFDLVAATDDAISEDRAKELTARAGLLVSMTPAKADIVTALGVTNRADLASRTVDELFALWQCRSPYTHPAVYDRLGTLVELARGTTGERTTVEWWQRHREREGLDLVRVAWEQRFGPGAEDRDTGWTLRMPALRLQARVAVGSIDRGGTPRPPREPKIVTADDADRPRVVVGHWKWAGRDGAFLRLENAAAGDGVQLCSDGDRHNHHNYIVTAVRCGPASTPLNMQLFDLVVMTPPHLRWPQLVEHWNLPAGCDERTWLKVSVGARRTD